MGLVDSFEHIGLQSDSESDGEDEGWELVTPNSRYGKPSVAVDSASAAAKPSTPLPTIPSLDRLPPAVDDEDEGIEIGGCDIGEEQEKTDGDALDREEKVEDEHTIEWPTLQEAMEMQRQLRGNTSRWQGIKTKLA